jgi:hypothetical protein
MSKQGKLSLFPYIPFLFFSIFLGVIISFAINYFKTGKTSIDSRDPLIWLLSLCFFVIFVLLYKFIPPLFKCSICKKPSKDILIYTDRKRKRFCRDHLLEEFKKEFLNFNEKMVVFYPSLESKVGPYVYHYQAISDVPKKLREDKVGQMINQALNAISGKCSKCGRPANIAYFDPGTFRWEVIKSGGVDWDLPKFEEISVEPQMVCSHCVIDEIIYSLRNFQGDFGEGVGLPYNGRGVFLPGIV